MVKTIVTGSTGFVGRHFCSNFGGVPLSDHDGVVDLRDALRVKSVLAELDPNAVLHLAAQSSVAESFSDPMATFAINFAGTLNLLQALSSMEFRGVFVYVGSADVYGRVAEAALPIKETQPLAPRSPYSVSKVAAEALCYQWSQTSNFRVVLARPFNQIGPGQDARFAIAHFAQQIIEVRRGLAPPVLVAGDLDVTRDFTDVRDAVYAYNLLLERGKNGEIYNICSGREWHLRSLVEEMLQTAGVKMEIQIDPTRLRPVEQRRMVGDPSKINDGLGWKPKIDMKTTLSDILNSMETK